MVYLSPLAAAVPFSIFFYFAPHLHTADLHLNEEAKKQGTERER